MTVNKFLMMKSQKTEHLKVNKCFLQNTVDGVLMIFNVTYKVYA